ncbi:L-aspartate oxidase [Kozakia baliensis]|uniref:L-aspartate oxidase n=1 Tax=Kozakia baliensis TaxID=153496 RepID=UPI00345BC58E
MSAEMLTRYAGWPVIAGAGLAGLSTALHLDGPCVVLSPSPLGENAASSLAQGGIAAALGPGDSPALHAQDTLAAGAGLCDPAIVRTMTQAAPDAVRTLLEWGVPFDRHTSGALDLHLEAAHSRARIAHAAGDGSGAAIMRALIARVRATPRIIVLEGASLRALDVHENRLRGIWVGLSYIPTSACVIASGGVGALYAEATSPSGNRGLGLAIAARAGARMADMEFVQFHPTALDIGDRPGRRPLVSEAVRGAGAALIDETGERFTDELASRDVVSRAIAAHLHEGHRVFLDARKVLAGHFAQHFPTIAASCAAIGIDPDLNPIPVRPAVHYHMGGIEVDARGRSSISGLWAAGEAACTGLHGANRLASNSLLEAFVTGQSVAQDLNAISLPNAHHVADAPPALTSAHDYGRLMSAEAGILRNEAGLSKLRRRLSSDALQDDHALVGAFIAHAALQRRESRGSHWRTDYPERTAPHRNSFILADLPLHATSLEYA